MVYPEHVLHIWWLCWVCAACMCRVVAGDLAQCLTVDIICAFAGRPGSVLLSLELLIPILLSPITHFNFMIKTLDLKVSNIKVPYRI